MIEEASHQSAVRLNLVHRRLDCVIELQSGLLYGVGEDAAYVASRIMADDRSSSTAEAGDVPDRSWLSHNFCAS
jgi:hypothetical protein